MSHRWRKQGPPSLAVQAMHLHSCYPDSHFSYFRKTLKWEGIASARGSSLEYRLKMSYQVGVRPKIWVTEPNLVKLAGDRPIPHVFSQEDQILCLHDIGVWKPTQFLARTIVPWALLWTEYFEWWLVTGRWAGDEVAHSGLK